jgi:hypothetical protein
MKRSATESAEGQYLPTVCFYQPVWSLISARGSVLALQYGDPRAAGEYLDFWVLPDP